MSGKTHSKVLYFLVSNFIEKKLQHFGRIRLVQSAGLVGSFYSEAASTADPRSLFCILGRVPASANPLFIHYRMVGGHQQSELAWGSFYKVSAQHQLMV